MNIKDLEDKLKEQVQSEYNLGFNHIREERERKRDIMKKVLDNTIPSGQVRVNLLDRNIQLELALFLTDEIGVKFLSSEGVIQDEIMDNANKMAQYDDLDMDMRTMRETIVNQNALYGLSVTTIDAWDDFEKQPISDVLDPLACIFDPQNYNDSKMRFFGVERRVNKTWLQTTDGFEAVKDMDFSESSEIRLNKQASDSANNLGQSIVCDEGMADIYDHFTIYDGKKWLTTWANDRTILIRAIELEPLTTAEKKNPLKVKYPVQLHRRKPKFGSSFGQSIADEVLQFQDAISILTNLQLILANNLALGPDIYVDDKLGIDTETLSKRKPGGRIIPISNSSGLPTQNGIYTQQLPNPSQYVDGMIQALESRAEQTTNVSQQSFGVSQSGSQTKAEIQTLQQNQNQILIWISNNYMKGQKDYWEAHYRCYALNMGKGRKNISLFQKGNAVSASLKREDFIADGKVTVFISSKSQDSTENDKEFNKLLAIANLYLANIKHGYSLNSFLRKVGQKTNIRNFDEYQYIPQDVDEMNATKNLSLINKNIQVPSPAIGENYMTYLLIYRQGLDTEATRKAVFEYEQAYMQVQKPMEDAKEMMQGQNQAQGSAMTSAMASNNLNQTQNNAPSTAVATM